MTEARNDINVDDDGPAGTSASPARETLLTDAPEVAARICRNGEPVAFPTETVYGLGARISDEAAIRAIYDIKGRPSTNPLIAHLAEPADIVLVAARVPVYAERLVDAFVPGPLTLVLDRAPSVPSFAFPGLDTIAVRVPDHDVARTFIRHVGEAVVAPSANRSGRPSPTRWQDVEADLGGRCACILRGDPARQGLESTVIDCTGNAPLVLRPGSITIEQLRSVVPGTTVATEEALLARSPGTRFRHYAPRAAVTIVDVPPDDPPARSVYLGLDAPSPSSHWLNTVVCADHAEYARVLYAALRDADRVGAERVICQRVPRQGIGVAIMDRLERAAAR